MHARRALISRKRAVHRLRRSAVRRPHDQGARQRGRRHPDRGPGICRLSEYLPFLRREARRRADAAGRHGHRRARGRAEGEPERKAALYHSVLPEPSGITTTLEKRTKVYELACRYDIAILEDNPYGELRFSGEDVPTIKSMDTEGRVLYAGSFSKVMARHSASAFSFSTSR